jgi:hypothetical protein
LSTSLLAVTAGRSVGALSSSVSASVTFDFLSPLPFLLALSLVDVAADHDRRQIGRRRFKLRVDVGFLNVAGGNNNLSCQPTTLLKERLNFLPIGVDHILNHVDKLFFPP